MKLSKENIYNTLVAKLNNIDATGFVLKAKYDTDISDLEKKISNADKKYPILVVLFKKQIMMLKLIK